MDVTDTASSPVNLAAEPARQPKSRLIWLRALAISAVVGFGFWWLLRKGALPIVPPASAFSEVRWPWVWLYVGMWVVLHTFRCCRWYFLVRPVCEVSFLRPLLISLAGYGAQVILPFRMGEAVRPTMIARRGNLTWLAAAGTVGAERVVDGAFLSLGLGAALLSVRTLDPLPTRLGQLPLPSNLVRAAAMAAVVVFLSLCIAMWVFYARRIWAEAIVRRTIGRVSERAGDAIIKFLSRVSEGLAFLSVLRYSLWFLALTAIYWALCVASMQFLFRAVGLVDATFLQTMIVLGVMGLGLAIPNAPGFFGSFQISCYAALVMFFPAPIVLKEGAAYVFLLYVIQLSVTLVLGLVAFLAEEFLARASLSRA